MSNSDLPTLRKKFRRIITEIQKHDFAIKDKVLATIDEILGSAEEELLDHPFDFVVFNHRPDEDEYDEYNEREHHIELASCSSRLSLLFHVENGEDAIHWIYTNRFGKSTKFRKDNDDDHICYDSGAYAFDKSCLDQGSDFFKCLKTFAYIDSMKSKYYFDQAQKMTMELDLTEQGSPERLSVLKKILDLINEAIEECCDIDVGDKRKYDCQKHDIERQIHGLTSLLNYRDSERLSSSKSLPCPER